MVPAFTRTRLSFPISLAVYSSPTPPSSQRRQLDAATMIAFNDPNNAYHSMDPADVAIDSGNRERIPNLQTAFKIEA